MKAVKHRSSNGTLRPPPDAPYEVPKDVLPITNGPTVNGLTPIRTYWQPSEEDIATILAGGLVELTVYGRVHPVIHMKVAMP